MKKHIFISVSVIILVFTLLVGCSNRKQNNKNVETTNISTVKLGTYIGESYNLTSSFVPILTLENNNKFKFELGISKSIGGNYKIDRDKLILTPSDGDEKYTFDITTNTLIIEQEIPNCIKKSTNFKLSEKE